MPNYPIEIHHSVTNDSMPIECTVVHSYFRLLGRKEPEATDLACSLDARRKKRLSRRVAGQVATVARFLFTCRGSNEPFVDQCTADNCSRGTKSSRRRRSSFRCVDIQIFRSKQMTTCRHACLFLICLLISAEAAKFGGVRNSNRGRGRGFFKSRMPILIPHRNPASANYYDHKDGARIAEASHFELDYMLGRKITFFCMATGYPRPEITWLKDGIEMYHHKFFQVHEWTVGNDTLKSKMEIDPATQKDAGYYECQADNQYAVDRRGFRTDYVMITY